MPNQQIRSIAERLRSGETVEPETVRTVLSWFGAQRRGYWIVKAVRAELGDNRLATIPDLEATHIDGLLHFRLIPDENNAAPQQQVEPEPETSVEELAGPREDPTFRLVRLPAANNSPQSVAPDAPVSAAITAMIHRDFSQLPVMEGERTVKGVITWSSIGKMLGLGRSGTVVRDFMEAAHVLDSDVALFSAIELIVRNGYVLVRHPDQKIGGIVTTADLSEQFRQLAEPYLLLGEIENHLRHVIASRFSPEELADFRDPDYTDRAVNDVTDLTFGEYIRLVEANDRWARLALPLDRAECVRYLKEIREIRNDVMHFDPDPLGQDRLETLRCFARLMQTLRQVGVV